eukprot:7763432-Lingulodinium_polyedra.AAC.1
MENGLPPRATQEARCTPGPAARSFCVEFPSAFHARAALSVLRRPDVAEGLLYKDPATQQLWTIRARPDLSLPQRL